MLSCLVTNKRETQQLQHENGPLEFGRGPRRQETPRCIIQDPYVSKDHVRVEETIAGQIRVENLSTKQPIWLTSESFIEPGQKCDLSLPLRLVVGDSVIDIDQPKGDTVRREFLDTIAQPVRAKVVESRPSLMQLGKAPTPETLIQWFETVVALQRAAVGSPEFYQQTAQALVDLVGMDRALVLLRLGDAWKVAARAFHDEGGSGREFSHTILQRVVEEKRTFFQSGGKMSQTESLQGVQAVVASPILDSADNVVGIVYGSRSYTMRTRDIGPLDAQIVQLLAGIVGSGLVRLEKEAEANRMRIAMEAAAQADQAKSKFLSSMSHELRTPLNAIIGYSEFLQEELGDAGHDEFIPDLGKILSSAKHLLALINDILDLSKIEAGKMDLFPETFSVPKLVEEVQATLQPLAAKNKNQLQMICSSDIGTIHADQMRVRQCLFNLLSNGCKFTENGLVKLEVNRFPSDGKEWVQFRVSDTGMGMTPEQKAKVGQDYTRDSTASKIQGTGLGLAITFRFIRMMGGEAFVESELHKGSTFTIQIPTGG